MVPEAESTERVLDPIASGALLAINSSEIDRQVATAKAYPRSLQQFRRQAAEMITLDQESAASCIYALPRGKEKNQQTGNWERKIVKGPTARFAEIIAYAWGNCRCGARIVGEDQDFVTAQGFFFDVERNIATSYEVKRRIVDSEGRRYSPDLIVLTSNAACAIALRNAVLKAVPQPIWKGLYLAAEQTIVGDRKTLIDRRQAMLDLFKPFGLTPSMVCQLVGVNGTAEVGGDQLVSLQGIITALRDGDVTVESLLAEVQDKSIAEKGKATVSEIKAKYRQPPPPASEPQAIAENPSAGPGNPAQDQPAAQTIADKAKAAQAKLDARRAARRTEDGVVDEKW